MAVSIKKRFDTVTTHCSPPLSSLCSSSNPPSSTRPPRSTGCLSTSQRVICPKCRLGVTRIQDLSQADMKKVRQLALIDMTALCDLLELEVKRHKSGKRKIPGMCRRGCHENTHPKQKHIHTCANMRNTRHLGKIFLAMCTIYLHLLPPCLKIFSNWCRLLVCCNNLTVSFLLFLWIILPVILGFG